MDIFFSLLRSRGAQISDEADFAQKVDLIPYEHGRISDDDFLDKLGSMLSDPLPKQDLATAWNNIFEPIENMLALAGKLNSQCRVFFVVEHQSYALAASPGLLPIKSLLQRFARLL